MGFSFRKSIKIGPACVNLSKSGVGFSVGTKRARVSRSAKGKTRASVSLFGSGLTYSKTLGKKKKK